MNYFNFLVAHLIFHRIKQYVILGGARLWVKAHQKKRYVIALRYEGEQEDRYIVATNTTWQMTDIAEGYTIRWLVEVFFSDWKQYGGMVPIGQTARCRWVEPRFDLEPTD